MDIEPLVKKHAGHHYDAEADIRAALTEQAETHAIEQRACNKLAHDHGFLLADREALQERIRQLEAERVPLADVAKATQLLKNERDAEAYELLVKVLAAAPQPKKEGE